MGIENDLNISAVWIIINIKSIMMLLPATVSALYLHDDGWERLQFQA